jgi:hypothetical protein
MDRADGVERSGHPPDIAVAGRGALVEEVEQVLLQVGCFNEGGDHKARRRALAVRAHGIRLPETALAPDEDEAAKDVEAVFVHVLAVAQ